MLNPFFWLVFGGTFLLLKLVADNLSDRSEILKR